MFYLINFTSEIEPLPNQPIEQCDMNFLKLSNNREFIYVIDAIVFIRAGFW